MSRLHAYNLIELANNLLNDPIEWVKILSSALSGFLRSCIACTGPTSKDLSVKEKEFLSGSRHTGISQLKNILDIEALCTQCPVPGSITEVNGFKISSRSRRR